MVIEFYWKKRLPIRMQKSVIMDSIPITRPGYVKYVELSFSILWKIKLKLEGKAKAMSLTSGWFENY